MNKFELDKKIRREIEEINQLPRQIKVQEAREISVTKSKQYIYNVLLDTMARREYIEMLMSNMPSSSTQFKVFEQQASSLAQVEDIFRDALSKKDQKRMLKNKLIRQLKILKQYGGKEEADLIAYTKNLLKQTQKDIRDDNWKSIIQQIKDRMNPFKSKTWKRIVLFKNLITNPKFAKFAAKRYISTKAKNLVGKLFLGGKRFDPQNSLEVDYSNYLTEKEKLGEVVRDLTALKYKTKSEEEYLDGENTRSLEDDLFATDYDVEEEKKEKSKTNSHKKVSKAITLDQQRKLQYEILDKSRDILQESDMFLLRKFENKKKKKSSLWNFIKGVGISAAIVGLGAIIAKSIKSFNDIKDWANGILYWVRSTWRDIKRFFSGILKKLGFDIPEEEEEFHYRNKKYGDPISLDASFTQFEGDVGTVSSGINDKGGASFGKYQFASNVGGLSTFMEKLKTEDPELFNELTKNGAEYYSNRSPNEQFKQNWKQLAATDPERFEYVQDNIAKKMWYNPAAEKYKQLTGEDLNLQSKAVQDAIFSASIQHGVGNVNRILKIAGLENGVQGDTEQFLEKFYDARNEFTGGRFDSRYNKEQEVMLAMHRSNPRIETPDLGQQELMYAQNFEVTPIQNVQTKVPKNKIENINPNIQLAKVENRNSTTQSSTYEDPDKYGVPTILSSGGGLLNIAVV